MCFVSISYRTATDGKMTGNNPLKRRSFLPVYFLILRSEIRCSGRYYVFSYSVLCRSSSISFFSCFHFSPSSSPSKLFFISFYSSCRSLAQHYVTHFLLNYCKFAHSLLHALPYFSAWFWSLGRDVAWRYKLSAKKVPYDIINSLVVELKNVHAHVTAKLITWKTSVPPESMSFGRGAGKVATLSTDWAPENRRYARLTIVGRLRQLRY